MQCMSQPMSRLIIRATTSVLPTVRRLRPP
jgi:hypothetical protein